MVVPVTIIFFILTDIHLVISQEGKFASFGAFVGDQIISKESNNFWNSGTLTNADNAPKPRRVKWSLPRAFQAFGEEQKEISVSKSRGVFRTTSMML